MQPYDQVRFTYLAAAVAMVCAGFLAVGTRAWFIAPVAATLLGFTVGHGRARLRQIKRGDFRRRG
jgi:hypothetical protein